MCACRVLLVTARCCCARGVAGHMKPEATAAGIQSVVRVGQAAAQEVDS